MSDRRSLAPKVFIDADRILELKAQGEAVESIRRALGSNGPGIRKIYEVIAEARAMHDPRAGARKQGSGHAGSTKARRAKARAAGTALPGWWFGAETIEVTRLGFGSADCQRVLVSVSCIPRRVVSQTVTSTPRKTDVHRTFADAFASLAGRQDRDARPGNAQAEPEKPTHSL